MLSHLRPGSDKGASAVFVAFATILIMGMAAIAIDVAAGFVERRGDQSAVDVGTVAGAFEVVVGTSGGGVNPDDMVTTAIDYVRSNLPTTYTNGQWQSLWEGCVDPASDRNSEPGDNFVALSPPALWGWTVADPANWCISVDAAQSLFRVRTPDQLVPTTFGRILGFDSLATQASAVAAIINGDGNILPFGFPSGAGDGVQQCLSDGPTGLAEDPCDGPSAGNFGTLKVRRFTPSPYNGCNVSPLNPVLALNIAAGIDHTIVPDNDGVEVRDICFNFPVDTLQTDTGFPQGTESGLATGSGLPAGETARLKQTPQGFANARVNVVGHNLDNVPLWYWLSSTFATNTDPPVVANIDFGGAGTADPADNAPIFCDPTSFSGTYDFGGGPVNMYDFDGDSVDDELDSWQHMERCLTDFVAGLVNSASASPPPTGPFVTIFKSSLGDKDGSDWSARFAYVPQFFDPSLGPGNNWLRVLRYRAVFIQGTWWKKGNTWVVHHPGEACSCGGTNYALKQVSSWIIPDDALPDELRGDPPSSGVGAISPFRVELTR